MNHPGTGPRVQSGSFEDSASDTSNGVSDWAMEAVTAMLADSNFQVAVARLSTFKS